jgi:phage terminase large subunit-like protein
VIVSLDGGGLDDLYGGNVLGRDKVTRDWLSWSHAWCHEGVLERRQSIASRLQDFKAAGELTIYETAGDDITAIVELIKMVKDRGLLGGRGRPGRSRRMVEALGARDRRHRREQAPGRRAAGLRHDERHQDGGAQAAERHAAPRAVGLMDWCVGNVKIEPTATAIRATKQNAGDAKIDPWAALMNSVTVMVRNPEPNPRSRSTRPNLS